VAAECDDADELEWLLTVGVVDGCPLLRAEGVDAHEYLSATSGDSERSLYQDHLLRRWKGDRGWS